MMVRFIRTCMFTKNEYLKLFYLGSAGVYIYVAIILYECKIQITKKVYKD